MTLEIHDGDSMRQLRARCREGGGIFRVNDGLAVLDPHVAQRINATNHADTTLPDRLVDVVRGRNSKTATWKEVRNVWAPQLKRLTEPDHVADLEARLKSSIGERLDREIDLPWAIQEIFTKALFPIVIADLSSADLAKIERDSSHKLSRLMRIVPRTETLPELLHSIFLQIRVGRVARRILRDRAKGRRARQIDLLDPLVDELPTLGIDRAASAVTAVLTAISGPPGAVAVCMILELTRRPEWASRLEAELSAADRDRFFETPSRAAPTTHRFVKEVLRKWSAPLILTRVVRTPLRVEGEELKVGDQFHLSPYFAHHDEREWVEPETFDPDRWLPESNRGPAHGCSYAPFGWAPTSCIGAHLGLTELMVLCKLFTTAYRIEVTNPPKVEVVLASVPLPVGFSGVISKR